MKNPNNPIALENGRRQKGYQRMHAATTPIANGVEWIVDEAQEIYTHVMRRHHHVQFLTPRMLLSSFQSCMVPPLIGKLLKT